MTAPEDRDPWPMPRWFDRIPFVLAGALLASGLLEVYRGEPFPWVFLTPIAVHVALGIYLPIARASAELNAAIRRARVEEFARESLAAIDVDERLDREAEERGEL